MINTFDKKESYAVLHGMATDRLALICGDSGEPDPFLGTPTVRSGELTASLRGEPWHISTHKLLLAALVLFTESNHTGSKHRILKTREVGFTLRDYAALAGVSDSPTALKNLRRKVSRDLDVIAGTELSWTENIHGERCCFSSVRLADSCGIDFGRISITLSQSYAEYLIGRPIMMLPAALFRLDERTQSSYPLGLKIAAHSSNRNNAISGTSNTLTVKTLLGWTYLPGAESLRGSRQSYKSRLKIPFDKALSELERCKAFTDIRYRDKSVFDSCEDWLSAAVMFRTSCPDTS